MIKVFFSYSHRDEELRNELETHLSMLKHQGVIETWHDRRILAGDVLDSAIDQHLEDADIILLLVSPDFLASRYCYGVEMKRAMERHGAGEARVLPVILRACEWQHAPFGKLLATPTDGKPVKAWPDLDDAFLEVTKAIRAAAEAIATRGPTSGAKQRDVVANHGSRSAAVAKPRDGLASATTPAPSARSSNLRISTSFTDHDRDRFLEEAFEHIANLFEGSLKELKSRNAGIETVFRRIDANHFSAVVYRDGKAAARCRIWLGGGFSSSRASGILYSSNDTGADNSWNEMLSVEDDKQMLFLRSMGMQTLRGASRESKMSSQGAAEFYWALFIEPLQR